MSTNFGRRASLILSKGTSGIDVAEQKIIFSIKKTNTQTPNSAEFKIYNLSGETERRIRSEFDTVTLSAGYDSNFGIIFTGNIVQFGSGRDNSTDSFLHVYAGDGDDGYNFGVVNATFPAGYTPRQVANASAKSMGIGMGEVALPDVKSVRGKVVYGMARDVMREIAKSNGADWSIQDGAMQVLGISKPAKGGVAYVLNSKTGMVGTPEQTNEGIKIKCLLNPALKIGVAIQINEAFIQRANPIQTPAKGADTKTPAVIAADGYYKIISIDYLGDTRGQDWYCDIVCIDIDATVENVEAE